MPVLSVQYLKKIYPGKNPFTAVDGISFDVKEAEIVGLLGPNGAGKTTTIQMLMSTLAPTSGKILYFGMDFAKHRSEILKSVTFASTYVSLPWNLSIDQNLEVFGRLFSQKPREFRPRKEALLERFGLASKRKERVSNLSSGQVTRLMIVKAFMVEPKIVLLDEPTASLDPEVAKEVIEFILQERKKTGLSILFTSHNMGEVSQVCDRVLFLKNGTIFADDVPKNLARKAAKCKLELIVANGIERVRNVAKGLEMEVVIEHRTAILELNEEQIAAFLSALAEAKVLYTHINVVQPTLEDFFLKSAFSKGAGK